MRAAVAQRIRAEISIASAGGKSRCGSDGFDPCATLIVVTRLALLICAIGIGCGGGGTAEPAREVIVEIPAVANRNLDLLFVIDDSANTAHLQTNLRAALPSFFDRVTNAIPTKLPDLHVGVITSDLGTAASEGAPAPPIGAVGSGGCEGRGKQGNLTSGQATTLTGSFVSDLALPDGARQTNYDGDLATVVGQMVGVGSTGCGFEQPLASMRAALEGNPNNADFVRPDAVFAVVLLMDEDDCSIRDPALLGPDTPENPLQSFRCTRFGVTCLDGGNTPDEMNEVGLKDRCGPNTTATALLEDVAVFRDFLFDLKGDPRKVVVGGMIGDPEPVEIELQTIGGTSQNALAHSCRFDGPDGLPNTSDDQAAAPGVRLQAFAELFGDRASTASVCQNDLSSPLEGIADRIAFVLGSPCVTRRLSGLQPDCIVEDLVGDASIPIASASTGTTCWTLTFDADACPLADHLRFQIMRETAPDPSTITRASCTAE